jgi:hypothetical protein
MRTTIFRGALAIAMGGLAFASGGCARSEIFAPDARAPSRSASIVADDDAAIARREVCLGSSIRSTGDLSDRLYYRATRLEDGRLAVGYFAFFSDERPWGNNWLTWTVVPAIAIDLVYSRSFFAFPGLRRALYGKGDVEGVGVVYNVARDTDGRDSLEVDFAMADDGHHHPVRLTRENVLAIDGETPVFYSSVWTHQLGAHGVHSKRDLARMHCYAGDRIVPLSETIVREFGIDHRAKPAHVERMTDHRERFF